MFDSVADGPPESACWAVFPDTVDGYFEGLSSERRIAWRMADSLSLRFFLDLDVTEASADHSTLWRTRRLIDIFCEPGNRATARAQIYQARLRVRDK